MGALVDYNQEPPIADMNRQIISEAKLWEAIQEARNELLRQRHQVYRIFIILFLRTILFYINKKSFEAQNMIILDQIASSENCCLLYPLQTFCREAAQSTLWQRLF